MMCDPADVADKLALLGVCRIEMKREWRDSHSSAVAGRSFPFRTR
jgi:hypothetical protein